MVTVASPLVSEVWTEEAFTVVYTKLLQQQLIAGDLHLMRAKLITCSSLQTSAETFSCENKVLTE